MIWFFSFLIILSIVLIAVLYFKKKPLISLFDIKSLDTVKEKKIKKQLVRTRAERIIYEKFKQLYTYIKNLNKNLLARFRPLYYWSVQEVEYNIKLNSKESSGDNITNEEELLHLIHEDPQNIKAYLELAKLYFESDKLDESIEVLAHVKRIAKKYPSLIDTYFEEKSKFQEDVAQLENILKLD